MTSAPQPTTVRDALVSLHMLVRSGAETGGLSSQHQQFQEWYASFEVECSIRAAAGGDRELSKHLKEDVLDIPAWEELILFASERVSRADQAGSRAVSTAIVETMAIDPFLAAEMIYRSTAGVWDEIKDAIVAFVRKWHTAGKVDRAVHFMISTGRSEFAPEIWRLISDADRNVHLPALRAGRRFRPSVLGDKVEARIAELPEEVRKHIISEIASQSGMDGIELSTNLARADTSPKVQASIVEALQFRRADRFVAEILHAAPDEVWQLLASKGNAGEIADPAAAKRLRLEQQRLYERETDPMRKIHMLLDAQRHGAASGKEIGALVEAADFPVKDQHARWIIDKVYQHNPDDITSALLHRLEAGRELPFRVESLLQAAGIAIDDGPVVDLVMQPGTRERAAETAVCIVGPQTVGRLIDKFVAIDANLRMSEQRADEATRQEYHRLLSWISRTSVLSFVQAVLGRCASKEPHEIGLLAHLLARHGGGESDRTCSSMAGYTSKWLQRSSVGPGSC